MLHKKSRPFLGISIAEGEGGDGTTGQTDALGTCFLTRPLEVVGVLRQARADIHQGSGAQSLHDKAGCMTAVYALLIRPELDLATMGESM